MHGRGPLQDIYHSWCGCSGGILTLLRITSQKSACGFCLNVSPDRIISDAVCGRCLGTVVLPSSSKRSYPKVDVLGLFIIWEAWALHGGNSNRSSESQKLQKHPWHHLYSTRHVALVLLCFFVMYTWAMLRWLDYANFIVPRIWAPRIFPLSLSHINTNKQELLATELQGHSFGTGDATIGMESPCVNLVLQRASSSAAAVKILEAMELGVPKECNNIIMRQYDALHAVCVGKRSCTPQTDDSLWESLHKALEKEDHTALVGLVGV